MRSWAAAVSTMPASLHSSWPRSRGRWDQSIRVHARMPHSPVLATGMEMLTASVGLAVLAPLHGDSTARAGAAPISLVSIAGWLYLVVFGSIVAFTAYVWLLQVSTPSCEHVRVRESRDRGAARICDRGRAATDADDDAVARDRERRRADHAHAEGGCALSKPCELVPRQRYVRATLGQVNDDRALGDRRLGRDARHIS